ncbi:MAG: L,D-transpeptidase [Candidatus Margulisiibacteriota bacterium]
MKRFIKRNIILITLCAMISTILLASGMARLSTEAEPVRLFQLKKVVEEFAKKHWDQDVIVVSKQDHLLYYCKNGRIVQNEQWDGFTFSFPVKVSLASPFYKTPEGLMTIDKKNARSRYTLFLGLSYPGAYGIHGASTRLASYLDKMETVDPNFTFVTKKDDTRGCVGVENRVIKYLFANVPINTPVLIVP